MRPPSRSRAVIWLLIIMVLLAGVIYSPSTHHNTAAVCYLLPLFSVPDMYAAWSALPERRVVPYSLNSYLPASPDRAPPLNSIILSV
jgi:hypothetical protein